MPRFTFRQHTGNRCISVVCSFSICEYIYIHIILCLQSFLNIFQTYFSIFLQLSFASPQFVRLLGLRLGGLHSGIYSSASFRPGSPLSVQYACQHTDCSKSFPDAESQINTVNMYCITMQGKLPKYGPPSIILP